MKEFYFMNKETFVSEFGILFEGTNIKVTSRITLLVPMNEELKLILGLFNDHKVKFLVEEKVKNQLAEIKISEGVLVPSESRVNHFTFKRNYSSLALCAEENFE